MRTIKIKPPSRFGTTLVVTKRKYHVLEQKVKDLLKSLSLSTKKVTRKRQCRLKSIILEKVRKQATSKPQRTHDDH
jgi:hypothetical protein